MVETSFILVLIVVAVGAVAVAFTCWAAFSMLRVVVRLFLGPGLKPSLPRGAVSPRLSPGSHRVCPRESCRSMNPSEARFCRRCGGSLDFPQSRTARRAAML